MENEEMFINQHQLTVLNVILSNVADSLKTCHVLINIKGDSFKHKLSGFEKFVQYQRVSLFYSTGNIPSKTITESIISLEDFISLFTCGGHRLEVKLFNELFFQKRLLQEVYKSIYVNQDID